MPNIETVRGTIGTADLGQVLMHEHVFILSHEFIVNYPDIEGFDAERDVAAAVARMNDLVEAGVSTIVDLTVAGLGRDVALVQQVAEQTPLNIVVATGYYTFTELPHFVEVRARFSGGELADMLAQWFIGDITEGIAHTGVKAGILKCATDRPGVTSSVEEVLRAVARAHRATGVPISTHTEPATRRGLEQQKVFESEGVDLSRVVIGHSGDTADLDYLEELLARGSYLGMDRFGLYGILSFEERVQTIVELCERGYVDRLVLSHDAACYNDWLPQGGGAFGPWHYCHISQDVLPALRKAGLGDAEIDTMLVDNPRRLFDVQGAY